MKLIALLVLVAVAAPALAARKNTRNLASNRPDHTECASTRAVCQNFHGDISTMINDQIKVELTASYNYQSMAMYFDRDDVALRGFSKFFGKMSDEERDHGQLLMKYQAKRGGPLDLQEIPKPNKETWGTGLEAFEEALQMERDVNDKLLDLHWVAQEKNDAHLADYLEAVFLTEQVDSIKQMADTIKVLTRMADTSVGEFLVDQELFEEKRP